MRVRLSRDVESRQLWRSLYHSIALLVLRQQCVDTGSLLSPALLKHKDFRAPGHETSQKLRKIRLERKREPERESLNEPEQVCLHGLVPVSHE